MIAWIKSILYKIRNFNECDRERIRLEFLCADQAVQIKKLNDEIEKLKNPVSEWDTLPDADKPIVLRRHVFSRDKANYEFEHNAQLKDAALKAKLGML